VLGKDADGKDIVEERVQVVGPSVVKTDLCKQHAPATKTHPKTAQWRQKGAPRHRNRKSMNRQMTHKPRKEK
jgi:hypothetical protein